ncbi:methyl-accepting chemotaxis protein [Paenibacillus frigoriresistens]|uniref:methyl-accepting chemotaxis protein n=1 Tax=Paenibacillus alginolyticus TaxID=59839 RepID=UPI00156673EB|nr:methyl-accepting chemotaxis protein [Paenibacillus frigoriresistens]NRF96070.1 methyl-accepting chemotaxis protein [Paenibacillus frigoriresistens]
MLKMTIKNRLMISFLAILILPCAAIGWFTYQKANSDMTAQIIQSASQSVDNANNQINDLISSSLSDMDYLAKTINGNMIDGETNSAIRQVLDPYKAVNPQFETVYFGTKAGLMVFSPDQKVDGYDPTKRPWFIKAMDNKGKAIIADPIVSATTGHVVVNPSKTSEDGSGVVGGSLDLGKLAQQVNNIKVGQKGYVTIMDKNHKYITHPTIAPGTENTESFVPKFYEKDSGTVDYVLNGVAKRAVFITNPLTGWKIVGSIEMTEIMTATQNILYMTMVVLAVAILIGILLVFWIVRSITSPLQQLMSITEKIAGGDLTEEVAIRSKDELGQLSASVNHMVHNLRDLIGGVISSSQNVAAASEQISATTEEIAGGSSAQAQAAQNMQGMFGELSTAIQSVAESAEGAAELASKTTSIAHDGGNIVKKSVESMNQVSLQMTRLEGDSSKIGEIIEVIDDIADQTNLLALNAAIEAARAGEQGRGFAVVADEVRKLAERSGEATKQITAIIKGMQENTHRSVTAVSDGVNQTQETGQAFERIIEMINQTEQKVNEIAAASEEQAAQSSEVMHSIESISSASQEAAAASEETAATSQSLAQLAEKLNKSVSTFKI